MEVPEITNKASGFPTAEVSISFRKAVNINSFFFFVHHVSSSLPVPQFMPKSQLELADMTMSPGATTSGLIRSPTASPIDVKEARDADEKMVLAFDHIRKKTWLAA